LTINYLFVSGAKSGTFPALISVFCVKAKLPHFHKRGSDKLIYCLPTVKIVGNFKTSGKDNLPIIHIVYRPAQLFMVTAYDKRLTVFAPETIFHVV
jgi:hypothetical protein